MTSAPVTARPDRPTGPGHRQALPVRRSLADLPIGGYALVEAALAWHQLRPSGRVSRGAGPAGGTVTTLARHLPLVETGHEEIAARLSRLLSGLTWPLTVRTGAVPDRWQVQVPQTTYHRVIRALTGAWRDVRRQFEPARPAGTRDRAAAAALWRMGLLIGDLPPSRDSVYLPVSESAAAVLLTGAAAALGVTANIERVRGEPAVVVCQPGGVRRLLAAAGHGVPARSVLD